MKKDQDITWYVVADGTRGRVLKLEERKIVRAVDRRKSARVSVRKVVPALDEDFIGRNLKSREILADRLGQRTPGNPAIPADPHQDEKFGFALELADVLTRAFNQHRFERLVIVAPPEMLGNFRQTLPEPVKRHIIIEEDKDLTWLPDDELAERLDSLTARAA